MNASMLDSLVSLSDEERRELLAALSDEECAALLYDWRFWARESQLAPDGEWRIWLVLAGRGFGKTRVGAEWTREQVKEYELVNLIAPTAADVRDVMIEGESGIMAVCPPWERPDYRRSLRRLDWPNGAKSLLFSAEDPESLRGPQHMRLWGDEVAAWQYKEETFDLAMFGLRLGDDPRALLTTTPKPIPLLRQLVADPTVTITKGSTYENRANLAPAFFDSLITRYEGTRLGRQELEAELLLDEGLAYTVIRGVHVIPPFRIPDWWTRFESMDHGSSAPTAWGAHATDPDGNGVTFDLYYQPGYPSEHATEIHKRRRASWWQRDSKDEPVPTICFADPTIKTRFPKKDLTGKELSIEAEYAEHGITFAPAQNDRRAGYLRVAELLRCDPNRPFPDWHPRYGEKGAPRWYILDTEANKELVQQLLDAPLEDPESPISRFPGEAVDQEWESRAGHAHAMFRYGLMSRPAPSREPEKEREDPRAQAMRELTDRALRRSEEGDEYL